MRRLQVLPFRFQAHETRPVFDGNIPKEPGYRDVPRRGHGALAETDRIMRDTSFVSVYPGLTEEMLEFVAQRRRPGRAQGRGTRWSEGPFSHPIS